MTTRPAFVLAAAACVLAGQVAGSWSAPLAVAVLAALRVGARWSGTRTLWHSGAATPRMPRRMAVNVSKTQRSGLSI